MVEKINNKLHTQGAFYSNKIYRFHKDANVLPLMNSEELRELGISIREGGQEDDIELIGDEIIDGRNRYLACHLEGITPRFKYFDSNHEPHDYVFVKNVLRRHLTPTQKSKVVLRHLKIERMKARKRMARTQLDGKAKNNKPKLKCSASNPESLAEESEKKGRAIDLVAEKFKMSPNSVKKIDKINKIAKNNPFIKKYWGKAQEENVPLEEISRTILTTLDIHNSRRQKPYQDFNKAIKIYEASKTDPDIKEQLEKVKKGEISLEVAKQNVDRMQYLNKSIRQHSIDNFATVGKNFDSSEKRFICKGCPKATVMAIGHVCEKCGFFNFISKVLCDDDMANGSRKLRDPNLEICENSPDYNLIIKQ